MSKQLDKSLKPSLKQKVGNILDMFPECPCDAIERPIASFREDDHSLYLAMHLSSPQYRFPAFPQKLLPTRKGKNPDYMAESQCCSPPCPVPWILQNQTPHR